MFMQDAVIAAKLRAALGFDDVDDLLVASRAMPVDSIGDYILTMLGDTPAAREIASLMGSKVPDATPSVATGGAAAADCRAARAMSTARRGGATACAVMTAREGAAASAPCP